MSLKSDQSAYKWTRRSASKILYVQYTDPSAIPPLEHSSQILANEGWEVLFYGVRYREGGGIKLAGHTSIRMSLVEPARPGFNQKIHYLRFLIGALTTAVRFRADCVYASDTLSTPAAFLLSLFKKWQVIYHEHDTYSGMPPTLSIRICLWARRKLLESRSLIILPTPSRLDREKALFPKLRNGLVVMNCPRLAEIPRTLPTKIVETSILRLYYHGSIVPGRMPLCLLQCMAESSFQISLTILGFESAGGKGYSKEFLDFAKVLGLADRVKILPAVARAEMLDIAKMHDVGLCILPTDSLDSNEANSAGGSNKAFEYLACGLALLVPDMPDWHKMFVEPGYAYACNANDPDTIKAALNRFGSERSEMTKMASGGFQRLRRDWNYEYQFSPALQALRRAKSSTE